MWRRNSLKSLISGPWYSNKWAIKELFVGSATCQFSTPPNRVGVRLIPLSQQLRGYCTTLSMEGLEGGKRTAAYAAVDQLVEVCYDDEMIKIMDLLYLVNFSWLTLQWG